MIKNGWYCCPYCGKKLFPVEPDTTAHNLPHKCRACKAESEYSTRAKRH